jgi:hypothetical protein
MKRLPACLLLLSLGCRATPGPAAQVAILARDTGPVQAAVGWRLRLVDRTGTLHESGYTPSLWIGLQGDPPLPLRMEGTWSRQGGAWTFEATAFAQAAPGAYVLHAFSPGPTAAGPRAFALGRRLQVAPGTCVLLGQWTLDLRSFREEAVNGGFRSFAEYDLSLDQTAAPVAALHQALRARFPQASSRLQASPVVPSLVLDAGTPAAR